MSDKAEELAREIDRKYQEVCQCGDYKHQHENGTGKCRVCGNSRAPYDGCTKYRSIHLPAPPAEEVKS